MQDELTGEQPQLTVTISKENYDLLLSKYEEHIDMENDVKTIIATFLQVKDIFSDEEIKYLEGEIKQIKGVADFVGMISHMIINKHGRSIMHKFKTGIMPILQNLRPLFNELGKKYGHLVKIKLPETEYEIEPDAEIKQIPENTETEKNIADGHIL